MNNINVKAGLLAGFISSIISSLVLMMLTSISLIPEFNFVVMQGAIFGFTETIFSAWMIYFIIGTFVWGLLYAIVEPRISGKSPSAKGSLFGFIIWLIIMMILMPVAGAGIFAKEYGYIAAGIVLVTDLIFGIGVGYFYANLRTRMYLS